LEKEINMKTLITVLIAGALSASGVFAEATAAAHNTAENNNEIATPKLPFRLFHKRPTGASQSAAEESKVNVGSPQLPFRLYQKQPTATHMEKTSTKASVPTAN
jgi:hypothetical protein